MNEFLPLRDKYLSPPLLHVLCPVRSLLGLGFLPVKNIVHEIEKTPRVFIPADEPYDQPVRPSPRMTPGTDLHADAAVRPDLPPIVKAGLRIQFPP